MPALPCRALDGVAQVFRIASEGERVGQQSCGFAAAGQERAELDGVDLDGLTVLACAVRTAGRARQSEAERLAVGAGPLRNDVGDEASVVSGIDVEFGTGGAGDVYPVHPDVAGEADVEQVRDRLTSLPARQIEQGELGDRPG